MNGTSSYNYGTGTAVTSIASAKPSIPSSLWNNSTKPTTRTVTRTVGTIGTDSSTTAKIPIPTVPSISIPPPPASVTEFDSTTSLGPSYTITTYTTVKVINTTFSSQLPGASTISRSAFRTTMRTTVVVTITNTVPLSTGTGYMPTNSGTVASSRILSLSSSSSIYLSKSLSYGTTSTSNWLNTTSTVIGISTKLTSSTETATTDAAFSSSSNVPCATDTGSASRSSVTLGTTLSSALPSLVTLKSTLSLSTSSDKYGYPPSPSPETTVDSAKPSIVPSSTSDIPGGYGSEDSTSSLGTAVSSALPSSVTHSILSVSGDYGDYPLDSKESTSSGPGTTIAS
ncbi:uncharacterized protein ColSpa_06418 [Colletotrichum spaethianum]|uniref:Uncharacterized protein n=1 Tax=Colletotrichum spaethianum TaxID=700344 RepID=A0AA37NYH3_9PEZI|nr:uncharacterized protein ColSpa_06418 [Colletotrichum spaethianum]GKT46237.1 hypothetical protein ColSpa_06418 [Colletotrichum spaethianum]